MNNKLALVIVSLALVCATILAIQYVSLLAERNDYLTLIQAYGLGCPE